MIYAMTPDCEELWRVGLVQPGWIAFFAVEKPSRLGQDALARTSRTRMNSVVAKPLFVLHFAPLDVFYNPHGVIRRADVFITQQQDAAMKLLAVNGSPRKQKNTGRLLEKVVEGAASKGAAAELVQLKDMTYRGCVSCFHCKKVGGKHYGRCALKDDLTPVLDKAHEADVLVLGSPFYFSVETSLMRSLMERLWFQYYLYSAKKPPLAPRKKATALLYTMNVPEEAIPLYGKDKAIAGSQSVMERLFGPCEVFLCCDTRQFDDYSKYEADIWDVPAKLKRHEEVFPQDLARAFELGVRLAS